jgi:spore maturation protein CgeB
MSHDVLAVGPAVPSLASRAATSLVEVARGIPAFDLALQRVAVRRALAAAPDLVLTVDARLDPQLVAALRKSGTRVALWFPDPISNLGRAAMLLAPYDAIFFKEPVLVDRLRRQLNLPVHYLPEACNPSWHHASWDSRLTPGTEPFILVAGNMYSYRLRVLERLVAVGLPLKVYGPPWPRWLSSPRVSTTFTGAYIARREKALRFRAAAAVLNTMQPAEIDGVNCRLFEAAGCGAAVLTESRSELSRFFEVGKEVLAFATFDELVDQARALIDSPLAGTQLGDAATERAHREHTYDARLQSLLAVVTA